MSTVRLERGRFGSTVLLRCRRFDPQRADLIHDLKQAWSGEKMARWAALPDVDKTAAILSSEAHDIKKEIGARSGHRNQENAHTKSGWSLRA